MDEKKTRITAYLPEALYERLRLESYRTKKPQTIILQLALEKYFAKK